MEELKTKRIIAGNFSKKELLKMLEDMRDEEVIECNFGRSIGYDLCEIKTFEIIQFYYGEVRYKISNSIAYSSNSYLFNLELCHISRFIEGPFSKRLLELFNPIDLPKPRVNTFYKNETCKLETVFVDQRKKFFYQNSSGSTIIIIDDVKITIESSNISCCLTIRKNEVGIEIEVFEEQEEIDVIIDCRYENENVEFIVSNLNLKKADDIKNLLVKCDYEQLYTVQENVKRKRKERIKTFLLGL